MQKQPDYLLVPNATRRLQARRGYRLEPPGCIYIGSNMAAKQDLQQATGRTMLTLHANSIAYS